MSKFLSLGILMLFASTAFAKVYVGDSVTYVGTTKLYAGWEPMSTTITLTQDLGSAMYDADTSVTIPSRGTRSGSKTLNVISCNKYKEVIENCSSKYGGTLEERTVPAGTFQTCKLSVNDPSATGVVWLAPVPFGLVHAEITSPETMNLDLGSFQAQDNCEAL